MDIATHFFRRACDESDPNSSACAKPTSTVLEDAVPAAVVGVSVVYASLCYEQDDVSSRTEPTNQPLVAF